MGWAGCSGDRGEVGNSSHVEKRMSHQDTSELEFIALHGPGSFQESEGSHGTLKRNTGMCPVSGSGAYPWNPDDRPFP